jgi:hypothetical protein
LREQIVLAEEATMNSNEEQKDLGRSIAEYEAWCEAYNHDDSEEAFALFLAAQEDREESIRRSVERVVAQADYDLENTPERVIARKAYFTGLGWGVS